MSRNLYTKPSSRTTIQMLVGCAMLGFVMLKLVACDSAQATIPITETEEAATSEYQLVWSDEFTTDGLPDATKWNYDLGGNGWGNNELQHYTNRAENARIEEGKLIIEAHREKVEEKEYTSARLVTRDRQHWTGGRIAINAKLPSGRGTWPAIWMLGTNIKEVGWPTCGEIDIMEHVGYEPDSLYGTIHTDAFNHIEGTQKAGKRYLPDAEGTFHVYSIEWTPEKMDFLVDEEIFFSVDKPENATVAEWPFDKDHYLLLNLAVGGNWGGSRGVDTSIWPQRMEVDWVRVWQR